MDEGQPGGNITADGPSEDDPDLLFALYVWDSWYSGEFNNPFETGQVVELTNTAPSFQPVENPTVIFTKP